MNSPSVQDPAYVNAFKDYMLVSNPQVVVTKEAATSVGEGKV